MVESAHGLKRILYWFGAAFFFVLAMIGVVLPGIPTTPSPIKLDSSRVPLVYSVRSV